MYLHSKKCWVVLTQLWVKYGQTQMLNGSVSCLSNLITVIYI